MAASSPVLSELAKLLQCIVTALPPETHPLVLRHLPVPELARLSCVHKAYFSAWQTLQKQHPGSRYAPPSAEVLAWIVSLGGRLERSSMFGDCAVIRSLVAAGVDEHGTPLLQSRNKHNQRVVDQALSLASWKGHVEAVELLLDAGADVHAAHDYALREASEHGCTAVVQLLIRRGANVHACGGWPLRQASVKGHADAVEALLEHGADIHAGQDIALRDASAYGHAAVVQLLLEHGADVHARGDDALRQASGSGHADVVQLLIRHGAVLPSDN